MPEKETVISWGGPRCQEVFFTWESLLTCQRGTHVIKIILTKDFKYSRGRRLREVK